MTDLTKLTPEQRKAFASEQVENMIRVLKHNTEVACRYLQRYITCLSTSKIQEVYKNINRQLAALEEMESELTQLRATT